MSLPHAGTSTLAVPLAVIVALGTFCVPLFVGPFDINGDTSWLIHVAERMLAGERAYLDIIENNPPMSILLYLPATWLAGVTGVAAERLVYAQTGLIAVGSILLSALIARRHLELAPGPFWLLLAAMAVAFLLVPSRTFTQREHLAAMLALPAMFSLAARANGIAPGQLIALACGVMAGLAACIKPHFALAIALPALVAVLRQRSLGLLLVPEAVVSAALSLAYVVLVVLAFPAFLDVPVFLTVNSYLLYTYSLADYLVDPPALVLMATLVVTVATMVLGRDSAAVLACGSGTIAFALAFIAQGKGFAYHLYPVVALALITVAVAVARLTALVAAVLCVAIAGLAVLSATYSHRYPQTDDLGRALVAQKPHPSLIIFTFDIAVNFPLVRQIEGVWASRLVSTWISNSAGHALARGLQGEQLARTRRAMDMERNWFAEDITRNRPDILVFDRPEMRDALLGNAAFRAAFDGHYAPAGSAQGGRFLLYRRQQP